MHRIVVCLVLGGPIAAVAASDDYEIQASSNAPELPVGQKLSKGSRIMLAADALIRFIDRTKSGALVTRQCGGKYEGPIENCRPPSRGISPTTPGGTRGPKKLAD